MRIGLVRTAGTAAPGRPPLRYGEFFYAHCLVCGCMGAVGTTQEVAVEKWRRGPPDGNFKLWFAHLCGETRH